MAQNVTAVLLEDSQMYESMIKEAMKMANKTISAQKLPSWIEVTIEFIRLHPWWFAIILLVVLSVISFLVRHFVCSYLKTNEILVRLKNIEEKLK